MAVLAHPGAPSRRAEVDVVASALTGYRPLARIPRSARLDGGDVLVVGRRLYVGSSGRTDAAGARALQRIAGASGYEVVPVRVHGCLHLKSAVTAIDEHAVLVNRDWIRTGSIWLRSTGSTWCPPRSTCPSSSRAEAGLTCKSLVFPAIEPRAEGYGVRACAPARTRRVPRGR